MKQTKLSEYIEILSEAGLVKKIRLDEGQEDKTVENLTYDTREALENALFVCKGAHFKREYAEYALNEGAVALVCEDDFENGNYVKVSDVRRAMPLLAKLFFDNAPSKITSVGITGTKGKSTTAFFMRSILDSLSDEKNGKKCAVVSSIETYDGVNSFESHITTPEAIQLYRHFDNAVNCGMEYLVAEVSSQALKYNRVDGIVFDVAVFTNIGTDHISPVEHENFDDYFSSKLRIFDLCKTACVNTDADFAKEISEAAKGKCRVITFGSHPTDDIYCKRIEKRNGVTYFSVKTPEFEKELCLSIPGLFNVSNALAAIAVSFALGISPKHVESGLLRAKVPGRMEVFESDDRRIAVVVDYAHNKMSFDALFKSSKSEYPDRKLISVFGCPGGKAHLRRHDLAKAADDACDYIIITEEDSGEEPFSSIASDISKNIVKLPFEITENRENAVRNAIFNCFKGEKKVILLTGKGGETRQKRGVEYVDCPSDIDCTLKYLAEYNEAVLPTA